MPGTGDEFLLDDYRTLVHALDVGVVLQRRDGAIVAANPAASRLVGLTHDQLLGRDSMDPRWEARREDGTPYPGEEHPSMMTLQTGTPYDDVLMQIARPNETPVWLAITTRPLYRDSELGPSHVAVTFRDVTESIRARLAELQLRTYIAQISDVVAVVSAEGVFRYISPSVERVLGHQAAQLVGTSAFDYVHPDDAALAAEALVGTVHTSGLAPPLKLRFRTASGDHRLLELVANNKTTDPAINGVVITARDITDRTRIEQQLREREREVELLAARRDRERLEIELAQAQRLEGLGRLAGGIAHDFNNLLGVIMNYTTLLHRRSELDARVRADVDAVHRAAERGADLVRQLLSFSGRDLVRIEPIDVGAAVRDVVRLLERTIAATVGLELDIEPGLVAEADRSQIDQLVVNLVLNARDAVEAVTEVGGVDRDGRVRVEVRRGSAADSARLARSVRDRDVVCVSVSDNGVGMSDDVVSRAFEPFFTTKRPGEGTGLGLSSVYGIVERLDGKVWIESDVGAGTSVHIVLPGPPDAAPIG